MDRRLGHENKAIHMAGDIEKMSPNTISWYVDNSDLLLLICKYLKEDSLHVVNFDENVHKLRNIVKKSPSTKEVDNKCSCAMELLKKLHGVVKNELNKIDVEKLQIQLTINNVPMLELKRKNCVTRQDQERVTSDALASKPLFDIFQRNGNDFDVVLSKGGRKFCQVQWSDVQKCKMFKHFVHAQKLNINDGNDELLNNVQQLLNKRNVCDDMSSIFCSLTTEENCNVYRALYKEGRDEDIILKIDQSTAAYLKVLQKSLKTLHPGEWLNNKTINHYMPMLNNCQNLFRKKNVQRRLCHILTTYFMKMIDFGLHLYNYESANNSQLKMPEPDIFQLDVPFIPINIRQFHWCGLSVDFQEKRIQMVDSTGRGHVRYLDIIFEYLKKV